MLRRHNALPNHTSNQKWFYFTLLYLVIDYGRPQDIIPIGVIRPGMLSIIVLTLFILGNAGLIRNILSNKQIKLILYFVLLLFVYVPFATNNYWAYLAAKNMLLFIPFIISIAICVDTVKRLKQLVTVLIILMAYMSLFSIFHKGMGTGAYFKDENDLSLYINTYLPFSYFLYLGSKSKLEKLFYLLCIGLGLLGVITSFSRGGLVGLIAMTCVAWIFAPNKMRNIFILCILFSVAFIFIDKSYINEMSTITDVSDGTANERILSWEAGWNMFLDNPLGVGGNNFMIRFPEYQSGEFTRGMWGRAAHSLWFTLLPELGILGVLIYFKLLYTNLRDIFHLKKIDKTLGEDYAYINSLSLALLASFVGYFASATFLSVLYYPHYYYLTAIIVAMMSLSINKQLVPSPAKNTNKYTRD
jgi:O-antigen ligase